MRNELFTATRGQGAQLATVCAAAPLRDLDGTILATGFRSKQNSTPLPASTSSANCSTDVQTSVVPVLRRWISAYVAAGRVDGFFEIGLRPWDFAAGELLVREARRHRQATSPWS